MISQPVVYSCMYMEVGKGKGGQGGHPPPNVWIRGALPPPNKLPRNEYKALMYSAGWE